MRLIKRETSVPVPEVYAFEISTGSDNILGCPFILIEFIKGKPLYPACFEDDNSLEKLCNFRLRVLKDLAQAMAQLNRFTFEKGGTLMFDDQGNVKCIGKSRNVDHYVIFDEWRHWNESCPDEEVFISKATPYTEDGPFDNVRTQMVAPLDKQDAKGKRRGPYQTGIHKLLRLFIEWAFEPGATALGGKFVLAHRDLNWQNIIVDDSGKLKGIIEWDLVASMPQAVGCQT